MLLIFAKLVPINIEEYFTIVNFLYWNVFYVLMEMPQEIEVWYVLPALRRELAVALKALGLTQRKIAKKLNITESAVSQYVSEKRGIECEFPKPILEKIKASAKRVLNGKKAMDELFHLSAVIKKEKVLCRIHKAHSQVPKNCMICLK
jgi:uncharacterized protein